jgi:hypothetical protein
MPRLGKSATVKDTRALSSLIGGSEQGMIASTHSLASTMQG